MPDFTTRLGLYKPGGGSTGLITPDEVVDIDKLNSNSDKIDASIGSKAVTSTSRPSVPFDGQIALESDTGNLIVWDGAGSYWRPGVSEPYCANATVRDAFYPNPKQGNRCYRADLGITQQYYELYDPATNPNGWVAAGWHAPISGRTPIDLSAANIASLPTGVTFDANGNITFNAYSLSSGGSLPILNCFWGLFQNYLWEIDISYSTDNYFNIDPLLSGTNVPPAGDYVQYGYANLSAGYGGAGPVGASTMPASVGANGTDGFQGSLNLRGPYKSGERFTAMWDGHVGTSRIISTVYDNSAGWTTNQFSGIKFGFAGSTSAGTMSGKIRLYGLGRS